jgi:hypothetical protein
MTVAGNSTMIHLFLGLPPASIRLEPFITTINQPPMVRAGELGLNIHPQATVDCLTGVAITWAPTSRQVWLARRWSLPDRGEKRAGLILF